MWKISSKKLTKDMKKANRKYKTQENMKSLLFSLMIREINIKPKKKSLHIYQISKKDLLILLMLKAVYWSCNLVKPVGWLLQSLLNLRMCITSHPAIAFLGIHQEQFLHMWPDNKIIARLLLTLFLILKESKCPKCPSKKLEILIVCS